MKKLQFHENILRKQYQNHKKQCEIINGQHLLTSESTKLTKMKKDKEEIANFLVNLLSQYHDKSIKTTDFSIK
jgi:hypothetical protein